MNDSIWSGMTSIKLDLVGTQRVNQPGLVSQPAIIDPEDLLLRDEEFLFEQEHFKDFKNDDNDSRLKSEILQGNSHALVSMSSPPKIKVTNPAADLIKVEDFQDMGSSSVKNRDAHLQDTRSSAMKSPMQELRKSHLGNLDPYSLDHELGDSAILQSGTILRNNHGAGQPNSSNLPKISKKMLKDKLRRAKQRNDQLMRQVEELQAQLDGRQLVASDNGDETPLVFKDVGDKETTKKTQITKSFQKNNHRPTSQLQE